LHPKWLHTFEDIKLEEQNQDSEQTIVANLEYGLPPPLKKYLL